MVKKQKAFLILAFVCVCLLLVGGGVTAFIINYNLQVAPTVEILDDGNMIFAKTQVKSDCYGYRFRFVSEDKTFYIESKNNVVEITGNENVEIGARYAISVCYLGEIEGNNSDYSVAVTWTSYEYLATPELSYLEDEKSIVWTQVENASYYMVYYGDKSERVVGETTLNLATLSGGEKDIFVIAYSDKNYYKASKPSNVLKNIVIYHELQPFDSMEYNSEQFVLTIIGREELKLINVYINGNKYETSNFTTERQGLGLYKFSVNISAIYHSDDVIRLGASPASESEFDVYNGEIKYL